MANNTTSNPWVLDTTGAITTDPVRVKAVRWVGAGAAAQACVISDRNGKVKWQSVASGANYVESDNLQTRPGDNWDGLTLTTLAAGTLFIELM